MENWLLSFGSELNQAENSASVNAANGIGNTVHGSIGAEAHQSVGDLGFDFGGLGGYGLGSETNMGFNGASVVAANGAFNEVGGDVFASADQHVGDVDVLPPFAAL